MRNIIAVQSQPANLPLPRESSSMTSPAHTPAGEDSALLEREDRWSHEGRKLGVMAMGAAGVSAGNTLVSGVLPFLPHILGAVAGPVGFVAGLVVATLEEKKFGIGKKIGGFLGKKAAAAASRLAGRLRHGRRENSPGMSISIPRRSPTGASPFEAILPRYLHKVEGKLLGHVPARTKGVEIGEGMGTTGGLLAGASLTSLVPMFAALVALGPITATLFGIVGAIAGMGLGSVEENSLGAGRVLGELGGNAAHFLHKHLVKPALNQINPESWKKKEAAPAIRAGKRILGKMGRGLLEGMQIMSEPIVSLFTDWVTFTNRLFVEKAYQTMTFKDRPSPEVNEGRLIENFKKLAGIEGTYQKEERISAEIQKQLDGLGIRYEVRPDRELIATIPATVQDAPTILLSAHMDTCAPVSASAIRTDGRRIFTDGSHILGADDRAGVAEILEGVRTVLEKSLPHPEIKLVFTTGEEVGLRGASNLKPEEISSRPTLGYVMDSLGIRDINLNNDNMTIVNSESVSYRFSQEDPLVQLAVRSLAEAGTEPRLVHAPIMIGAGTDANTKAFNGGKIRSLAIGAGEHDVHTQLEYIRVRDLVHAAKEVVGFLTNACDLKVDGDKILPRYS